MHAPGRILVVDDDTLNVALLEEYLANTGIEMMSEPGGATGIARAILENPDLILLDVLMPDMDGFEACRRLQEIPETRDIPKIFMTGQSSTPDKVRGLELGAVDYITKPVQPEELRARVRTHIRLRQLGLQLASQVREAADYVRALLPAPQPPPVEVDWRSIPCDALGGDAFGYHWVDDFHFAIYLLDVCGHGVGAALMSISAINVLRSESLAGTDFRDPASVLEGMSRAFPMERHNNMYFTLWYGVFDPRSRELACASAGHPAAVLVTIDPGGLIKTSRVGGRGLFIGADVSAAYTTQRHPIPHSAQLHIFSDGIFEVTSPQGAPWDLAMFLQTIREAVTADFPLDHVIGAARHFQGENHFPDDCSLVRVVFH